MQKVLLLLVSDGYFHFFLMIACLDNRKQTTSICPAGDWLRLTEKLITSTLLQLLGFFSPSTSQVLPSFLFFFITFFFFHFASLFLCFLSSSSLPHFFYFFFVSVLILLPFCPSLSSSALLFSSLVPTFLSLPLLFFFFLLLFSFNLFSFWFTSVYLWKYPPNWRI